jgi:hypothetical protein
MRIIETNKENYSGGTAKIRVKNDNSFSLYGYDFQLSFELSEDAECETFEVTGEGWDYPLVKGIRLAGDDDWLAYQGAGSMEEMNRESSDPFKAAVKVLSNII